MEGRSKECVLHSDGIFFFSDTVSKVYATEFSPVTSQEGWVWEQIKKQTLTQVI